MSDTKIHPLIARRDQNLKNRIMQREAKEAFDRFWAEKWKKEWKEFTTGPGIPIIEKIKKLPNFIVDGRLLSFTKGKSYPLENEMFIRNVAFYLYELEQFMCSTELPSNYTVAEQLKSLRFTYEEIVLFLEASGIKTKKGDRKIKPILDSWEKQYIDLYLKERRENTKIHTHILKGRLVSNFLFNVPQASNTDIARHILNIMQTFTEIPSQHLPKYNSLRQEISAARKFYGDKERERNHDIHLKRKAMERYLIEELRRVRNQIRQHGGNVDLIDGRTI